MYVSSHLVAALLPRLAELQREVPRVEEQEEGGGERDQGQQLTQPGVAIWIL